MIRTRSFARCLLSKCFAFIISLNLLTWPPKEALLYPFYNLQDCSSETQNFPSGCTAYMIDLGFLSKIRFQCNLLLSSGSRNRPEPLIKAGCCLTSLSVSLTQVFSILRFYTSPFIWPPSHGPLMDLQVGCLSATSPFQASPPPISLMHIINQIISATDWDCTIHLTIANPEFLLLFPAL